MNICHAWVISSKALGRVVKPYECGIELSSYVSAANHRRRGVSLALDAETAVEDATCTGISLICTKHLISIGTKSLGKWSKDSATLTVFSGTRQLG